MNHRTPYVLPTLLLGALAAVSFQANAGLIDQGNGTLFETDKHLAWTQNGNLFHDLALSNPNLVSDVINVVGGQITDADGSHSLNGTDFNTAAGTLDWYGAQAWVQYLNSVNYGGLQSWRLPSLAPANGSSFDFSFSYDGSTDYGYNHSAASNEWGHLFYGELGNLAYYDTSGNPQTPYGLLNTAPFSNLSPVVYWTGTDADTGTAWYFSSTDGLQSQFDKTTQYAVVAVADVPEPASLSLLLVGLLGFVRKGRGRICS